MWSGDKTNNTTGLACRGCLATGVKLYNIHENRLMESYVLLVGISLQDHYSQQLCSMCASLLRKFASFRERCRKAYQLLIMAGSHRNCVTTNIQDVNTNSYQSQLPYTQSETQTQEYLDFEDTVEEKIEAFDLKQEVIDGQDVKNEDSNISTEDIIVVFALDELKEKKKEKNIKNKKRDIKEEDSDWEGEDMLVLDQYKEKKAKVETKRKKDIKKTSSNTEEILEYAKSFEFDVNFLTKEEQYAEIEEKKSLKTKRPTQCKYCGKNCTTQHNLDRHFESFHDPNLGSHECEVCHFRFRNPIKLSKHLEIHKVLFRCKICSLTTKHQDTLHYHHLSHKGSKRICEFCQKVFTKRTTYFSHVRLSHSSELPWCEYCGESFINKRGMNFHKTRVHKKVVAKFPCANCGRKFCSDSALEKHVTLKMCDSVSCVQCGEGFATEQLLRYHLIQRHSADTPLVSCEGCGVKFFNAAALQRHLAACGTTVPCVQCGEHFEEETLMMEHVNKEHSLGTDFKCAECNKTFSNAYYYRDHILRIHRNVDGQASRKRKVRGAGRSRAEPALRRWRPAGERGAVLAEGRPPAAPRLAAVCEVCGKAFNCTARLDIHLQTHSDDRPHQCQHCSKCFRTPLALESHIRVHTGERPFKCKLCPKAFKIPTALTRHNLVHSGIRRHICQICEKSFQTSTSVKLHIKSVHMKIPAPPRVRRRRVKEDV